MWGFYVGYLVYEVRARDCAGLCLFPGQVAQL